MNAQRAAPADCLPGEQRDLHLDLIKCFAMGMMPFLHVFSMFQIEGLTGAGFPSSYLTEVLGLLYNFVPGMFFEDMGLTYIGPIDGHNVREMETAFKSGLRVNGPVLVHVITKKGKGYRISTAVHP